jgi:UDP-3-O-[3-hydroxymyristoyl] glucosamine N-acyltransferase
MRNINDIIHDSKPVIFLGSSSSMHNQIECCRARGREVVGIVDTDYSSSLHGLPILNSEQYFDQKDKYEFFVATFWSPFEDPLFERNCQKRTHLLSLMSQHQLVGATLIHPTTIVSPGATIGQNVSIGALSYISYGAIIHNNVVVREQCFVGHDVTVDKNTVMQIKSTITSNAHIESGAYIGVNSTIVNRMPTQGITIGQNSLIYPNELVLKTVPKNNTVRTRRKRG